MPAEIFQTEPRRHSIMEDLTQETSRLQLSVVVLCVFRERPGDGDDPKSPEWRQPLDPPSASHSTGSGISGA